MSDLSLEMRNQKRLYWFTFAEVIVITWWSIPFHLIKVVKANVHYNVTFTLEKNVEPFIFRGSECVACVLANIVTYSLINIKEVLRLNKNFGE